MEKDKIRAKNGNFRVPITSSNYYNKVKTLELKQPLSVASTVNFLKFSTAVIRQTSLDGIAQHQKLNLAINIKLPKKGPSKRPK